MVFLLQRVQKILENELAEQVVYNQKILSETGGTQIKTIFELAKMETLAMAESFPLRNLLIAMKQKDAKKTMFWQNPLRHLFMATIASHKFLSQLRYIDSNGHEIVQVTHRDGKFYLEKNLLDQSKELFFSRTMSIGPNQIYLSQALTHREFEKLEGVETHSLLLATPVILNNQKKGIITASIEMDKISDIIFNLSSEHAWLFDSFGKLLNCSMNLPQSAHDKEIELIFKQEKTNLIDFHLPLDYYHESGARTLIAYSPIEIIDQKWYVVSELPFEEISNIMSKSNRTRNIFFAVFIATLMCVLVYFYKIYRDQERVKLKAELAEGLLNLNKKLEKKSTELKSANESLEKIDRKKTDFLHMVAHDLRTPLTAIRSFSDLLVRYQNHPGKARNDYAEIIKKESIRLSNLIDNFLDISKIESGIITYNETEIDIKKVIDNFAQLFVEEGKTRNISIICDIEKDLPHVKGDRERLGQVFSNLLSNAIKFTPPKGLVTIKASLVNENEESGNELSTPCILVSVADTGIGIPAGSLDKIFDKFVQVNHPNFKSSRGSGLGLTISKEIIEQHGGSIRVESKEGKGTKIIFTLKALTCKEQTQNIIK